MPTLCQEDYACPRCHRIDQVRSVRSILSGGIASGILRNLGNGRSPESRPEDADPPAAWRLLAYGLFAWESVCIPVAAISTIDGSPRAGVWVACSILFGALMLMTFLARDVGSTVGRSVLERGRQARWNGWHPSSSLYCGRCHVVYEVA